MAVDVRKYAAPTDTPYRVIDYVNDKFMALWHIPSKRIMCGFEYWDTESQQSASSDLECIARNLNIADGSDPVYVVRERAFAKPPLPTDEERLTQAAELLIGLNFQTKFLGGKRDAILQEISSLGNALPEVLADAVDPDENVPVEPWPDPPKLRKGEH